jgi:formylglycine-generating enzyme required for sulfatase activity
LALRQIYLDKYSPDLSGPTIAVSWFGAAAYCNWLSEQEKIPRDQWCYVPNERGKYDKGMRIPADALQRKGYRLPTEAEWEYACRAGTVTSRYHGLSVELLGAYARYAGPSQEHAWRCGSLLPNDLGLFDLLGNVYEWCQEREYKYEPGRTGSPSDDIVDDAFRLCRGGHSPFYRLSSARPPVSGSCRRTETSTSVFALPGLTTEHLYDFTTPASRYSRVNM